MYLAEVIKQLQQVIPRECSLNKPEYGSNIWAASICETWSAADLALKRELWMINEQA